MIQSYEAKSCPDLKLSSLTNSSEKRITVVGWIVVKNYQNTAFCNEELKIDTVIEEAMKSKTGNRAKYYQSWLCDPGKILCFSPVLWS